jgi:2-dehydro-3-deoxy-L-fuconate 4-dehydrogenase
MKESNRLVNKTALVTGAAQGIGGEIVLKFVEAGAKVIATDINEGNLSVFDNLDGVTKFKLDVTDADGINQCAGLFSEVDVLVNCAGIVHNGTILDCTDEDFINALQVNVVSIHRMIKAFLPNMIKRESGSIINIASVASTIKGVANRHAYGTSKGAVIALTKAIAQDFIGKNIRCNAICPGTIHTPSLDERINSTEDPVATKKMFIDRQPMGRLGRADEIASAALMLASDEVTFMTGTNVIVDGGFSL